MMQRFLHPRPHGRGIAEDLVNSATTLSTDAYEIDQVKISEILIYNNICFTIVHNQTYSVYFRIKYKNSDSYVWKEGNWTVSGSTICC
jgi:hypothetical protein